jgi:alpha-mannosidase
MSVDGRAAGPVLEDAGGAMRAAHGSRVFRIFLIHHTHWDREWWATFQDFRVRLVELIDDLLHTLDRDGEFRTFLLDSQTIVLRDYLEIRPEHRDRLASRIREGRIECGPWYILPDEFLVGAEAHVRNLLMGRRVARDLDIPLLSVGYLPDTFGHIGQMPQILRGFGIDNAFMWRGRGGDPEGAKQEFLWQASDGGPDGFGSEVLTHWFPSGYYQMPFLHFGNPDRPYEDKLGRILHAMEEWGARATTDALLMPYGGDHRPIDPNLATKIREANEAIAGLGEVRWATAQEYIAAVREADPQLETVRGELRSFGPFDPHILPGVLSARLYLKRANFWGQTWLERFAEPMSAMAWVYGRRYDEALLWKAWELLIQNHPHDSICGCSIDQVHREMMPRFDQSRQIAEILTEKSAQHLNARIDTSDLAQGERALVVHNPLPRERGGWASVWVPREDISPRTHRLLDDSGAEIPFHARDVGGSLPMIDTWRHTEVGFVADRVPGLGYRTFRLTRRDTPLNSKQVFSRQSSPPPASRAASE